MTLYRCADCGTETRLTPLAKKGLMMNRRALECPKCKSKAMKPVQEEKKSKKDEYFRCMADHYFKVNHATITYGNDIYCPRCGSKVVFKVRKKDYEAKGDANELQVQHKLSSVQRPL